MAASPYRTEGLPPIWAGVAQSVITPPLGVSLAGYFHDRVAARLRDDLYCHAVVLEGASGRIALVSCDLISVDWFGYIPTTDQAHRGAYGAKPILSRRLEADGGRRPAP